MSASGCGTCPDGAAEIRVTLKGNCGEVWLCGACYRQRERTGMAGGRDVVRVADAPGGWVSCNKSVPTESEGE